MNPILDRCIFTAAFSIILCLSQTKLQMKQPTQLSKSLGYILNDNEAFWEIALEQVDGPKYFKLINVTFFFQMHFKRTQIYGSSECWKNWTIWLHYIWMFH